MKFLNANCLHSGDWAAAAPQYRDELKQGGKITTQFPANHNGGWIWTQALRELGHEVIEFDYRSSPIVTKELRAKHPWLYPAYESLLKRSKSLVAVESRIINKALLQQAEDIQPDVFITYPGERIFPETIEHMSQKMGITTVLWLGRDVVYEKTPNVVESFPYYDFVFTIDPPAVRKYKENGARRVHYLPLGCYPPTHRPIELSEDDKKRYAANLSFVGQLFDDRPEYLCQLIDRNVNFWTHWWGEEMQNEYPQLTPLYRGEARGTSMIKVLNGANIVLNVHRATNSYEGTNMRTFEAAGCAAFQLTEYKSELGRLFKVGEELEVYTDMDDLKKKIDYYTNHPDEAAEIAQRAQKRAYADHTYHQRFEEMIGVIDRVV